MDLYRDIILDHYKNPRNFGHLSKPHVSVQAYNATCGDKIKIEIRYRGQIRLEGRIADIRFSGEGCAISQASASMLTEKVKTMSGAQILGLSTQDILQMLGITLTPSRIKCAVLPLEVIQQALQQPAQ